MNHWIAEARAPLEALLARVDLLVINDEEARELAGERNVVRAARRILALGVEARADQARRVRRHPLLGGLGVRGPGVSARGGVRPDRRRRHVRGRPHGLARRVRRRTTRRRSGAPSSTARVLASFVVEDFGGRRMRTLTARRHRAALSPVRGADPVLSGRRHSRRCPSSFPLFDEEENVVDLVRELGGVLDGLGRTAEIVIVDDGSTDRSFARLVALQAEEPRLRVVRLTRNYGQTAAMAAGIAEAHGDVLVTMDGDRQNDPRDIPKLLDALGDDVDVVHGWRVDRQDGWWNRRLPSMLANRLISFVTGTRLHDYGCTMRIMRTPLAKELPLYGELHRFIPALAANLGGARGRDAGATIARGRAGRSKYGIGRTTRVVLDLLTVKFLSGFSTRPIQLFGLVGLVCALVGFGLMAELGFERLVLGIRLGGRPIVLLAILLGDRGRAVHLDRAARRDGHADVPRVPGEADLPRARGARRARAGAPASRSSICIDIESGRL